MQIYLLTISYLKGGIQSDKPQPSVIIPAAAFGGTIISFVLCPSELVKVSIKFLSTGIVTSLSWLAELFQCRMQVQGTDSLVPNSSKYNSPLDCVAKTFKSDGVRSDQCQLCIWLSSKLMYYLSGYRHFPGRIHNVVKGIYWKCSILLHIRAPTLLHSCKIKRFLTWSKQFSWYRSWSSDGWSEWYSCKYTDYLALSEIICIILALWSQLLTIYWEKLLFLINLVDFYPPFCPITVFSTGLLFYRWMLPKL